MICFKKLVSSVQQSWLSKNNWVPGRGVVCVHTGHFLLHNDWVCIWLHHERTWNSDEVVWHLLKLTISIYVLVKCYSHIITNYPQTLHMVYVCLCDYYIYITLYHTLTNKSVHFLDQFSTLLHLPCPAIRPPLDPEGTWAKAQAVADALQLLRISDGTRLEERCVVVVVFISTSPSSSSKNHPPGKVMIYHTKKNSKIPYSYQKRHLCWAP